MSQVYYTKEWEVALENLKFVINNSERPLKPEPLPKTLRDAFNRVCCRYVQYIGIYKQLNACLDHMVHPQKRELIVRCIEGVIGRLVELRHELFRIELSEYAPFGPFCVENQILPADLEMELSRTFHYDKQQRLQRRADLLDYILKSSGKADDLEPVSTQPPPKVRKVVSKPVTTDGSQFQMSQNQSMTETAKLLQIRQKSVNWRKVLSQFNIYQNRIRVDQARYISDGILGLDFQGRSASDLEVEEQEIAAKTFKTAQEYSDNYVQRTILETETVLDSTAALNMEQDIEQNIRQWMLECRAATGKFPDYPAEEVGGSAAIFADRTVEEVADELEYGVDDKAKSKAKEKAKKSGKREIPEGFVMKPSNFIDDVLMDVSVEYDNFWKWRDESSNFKQEFSQNLLKERVTANLEELLRKQIDEQMRQELDILTEAIERTKLAKAKPKKKKPEKKKKQKKDKRKRLKDLTPNADIEDLFSEMVRYGIIKRARPVRLKDFLGEVNLIAEGESDQLQCKPDLGDVRKMIFDFAVLPMCNKNVREQAPCCKSLLIVGPPGSGKKTLVHAICNELGANLFDLTAANIRGIYDDKEGPQMLMHLVMKVGKALEPSIIFIEDCELMFAKKLPPDVKTNPGRLKGNLTKAMKTVGLDDRIMLIGTTYRPFLAAKGPLLKMYERIIFIYPPAYGSRYTIWETAVRMNEGVITRALLLSVLAQISSSFTAHDIIATVKDVMTPKRVKRQATKNLHTVEFVDVLSESAPVFVDQHEALVSWLKETPLFKKREQVRVLEEAGINIFDML
ncbi:hypothetical protein BsWGS_21111 [Bradybaena similaris]